MSVAADGPSLAEMHAATALFLGALDRLSDDALDAATSLPGWTRRRLVGHVHFNARALRRLVSWAATGVENRMYASADQRATEIEQGATLPVAELRRRAHESAGELAAALEALPTASWQVPVVTAQGRRVLASEVPWLRTREVAVHAVDLAADVAFADLPAPLVVKLLVDVVGKRAASGEGPALAAWLTGRTAEVPRLGPWL